MNISMRIALSLYLADGFFLTLSALETLFTCLLFYPASPLEAKPHEAKNLVRIPNY